MLDRRRLGIHRRTGAWPHVIVLDPYTAGLAVARRMVRLGARVTVVLEPSDPYVAHARGIETVVAPFADGSGWLTHLQALAGGGDEAVVLPATDRSCELLLRDADLLAPNLYAFERSGSAHLALMNKQDADRIARDAGVRVPWTARIETPAQLADVAEQAPWPCVVKPVFSHEWRSRYGEERTFLVANANEAAQRLARPLADGVGMLLCQYIPGGDEDVEEAIVVRLADGNYPVRFGCRKLRQNPPGFGATTVGEASPLPETTALAERVLEQTGFVGVAGVETKRHAVTGERWFLEVNVRIPGQWSLGDTCGAMATPRLVAALAGRPLGPQPPRRDGVRMVQPDADARVVVPALLAAPAWRRPGLAWQMLRIYAGARDFGVLDLRDPAPGLAYGALLVRRRLARLLERVRSSGN
jgi:predicted ATP-grasp superfamily ATP-dependent carboligase